MSNGTANMEDLRRGRVYIEGYDDDGNPMVVQDHSGRDGHGRIQPKPAKVVTR